MVSGNGDRDSANRDRSRPRRETAENFEVFCAKAWPIIKIDELAGLLVRREARLAQGGGFLLRAGMEHDPGAAPFVRAA